MRKLAERSQAETKAIASLVGAIRRQIQEAVVAMQGGSVNVEETSALGKSAAAALVQVLTVVAQTTDQTTRIGVLVDKIGGNVAAVDTNVGQATAVAQRMGAAIVTMSGSAKSVDFAVQSITEIAERTGQAATSMSATANRVGAAMSDVAAVTEEQSASVEELAAGTQELARLTADLQRILGRFVLDASPAPTQRDAVVAQRRGSDWQSQDSAGTHRRSV